jgi:hypothetical protein
MGIGSGDSNMTGEVAVTIAEISVERASVGREVELENFGTNLGTIGAELAPNGASGSM